MKETMKIDTGLLFFMQGKKEFLSIDEIAGSYKTLSKTSIYRHLLSMERLDIVERKFIHVQHNGTKRKSIASHFKLRNNAIKKIKTLTP